MHGADNDSSASVREATWSNYSEFRGHNKLGYIWVSLRTPLEGNFDAGLATMHVIYVRAIKA